MCETTKKLKINKCRTQVLIVHCEGLLCILQIVKVAPQTDTGSYRMWV